MRLRDILSIYASGLCELLLTALGAAVIFVTGMNMLAALAGGAFDGSNALLLAWQGTVLMALWPGQTFWTIRRATASGLEHSIIGVPSDDDLRSINRLAARRNRTHLHD